MNDVVETAKEYWRVVARRAIAHEKSAEWHRKQGAQLGVWATIFSAVVGTTIFATIASQLGFNGQGQINFRICHAPTGGAMPGAITPAARAAVGSGRGIGENEQKKR